MKNLNYEEKVFDLIDEKGSLHFGQVYIAKPVTSNKKQPLLIALHGSGREALSYRDVAFYVTQRDIALKAGYIFACISNSTHTFGTDKGYMNVIALYEYMKSHYSIYEHIALWASSAGGIMMQRFFREYSDDVKVLLGTFPIFNPITTIKLDSLLSAYDAKNEEEFIKIVNKYSPLCYPLDIYKDTNIVVAHGINDHVVPISQSEEWVKQVNTYGGKMELIKVKGGHSANNFEIYKTDSFYKALIKMKKTYCKAL